MSSHVPAQILPLPAMTATTPSPHTYMPSHVSHAQPYVPHTFDTTGQIPPPGAKPRVTATLWEDEGSLCFQVEAKGVCVARREDNHMINGTKLLNVAGMTRGRRDGILKSEKVRNVVKIGPMHLKGRGTIRGALKQVRLLDRHKLDNPHLCITIIQCITLLTSHKSVDPNLLSSMGSHSGHPRPGLDRSHTFPTPPTSASGLMGIGSQGGSYEWSGQNMGTGVQGSQALSIDTGLTSARSMPTTPATTPPGTSLQNMQSYQSQPSYDSSKSYYSAAPTSQAQYAPHNTITQQSNTSSQGNGQVSHGPGEGEADHDNEPEYINDTNASYSANRGSYAYTISTGAGNLNGEHSHLSSEITDSSSHPNGSDSRVTPRTSSQSQWKSVYPTPSRPAAPSSNLYSVMSDTRGTATNGTAGDSYSISSNGPSAYSSMNGSGKRMRDDDNQDQTSLPDTQNGDSTYEHKRRKTLVDGVGGPVGGTPLEGLSFPFLWDEDVISTVESTNQPKIWFYI
ncbi:predicted protein [Histoplasma mississippiense (nom. inval.)]|uniref:predicted protein n=1 Tax=Ajellomyces capsulatus (strain NAm1 / WU24) TaxID=2059318 RepID=UPI000157CF13|nr:predicted protein [Histoplasma mississippiense (nom. inval.)]EDN10952.1 predicted protein [Histoplasma mississippiense (nom. inval.)]